jgi:hypothetical protein
MNTSFESNNNDGSGHRELAYRSKQGLEVALLWEPTADALVVRVSDHEHDTYFEISPKRDLALDVYYHPYAYLDSDTFVGEDARLAA